MLALGASAPDFSLPNFGAKGESVSIQDFREAAGLLVVFICNHCPHVHHVRGALVDFAGEYQPKGLAIVGINANDVASYPDDSPDRMAEEAANFGYTFPYLFDETQEVAKAYRAACTPDFFLFDKARKLVYRGQFDDSRPKNDLPVTGRDLRAAADALLSGGSIDPDQKASFGCNVKWKEGNEPDYFRSIRLKSSEEWADSKANALPREFQLWGITAPGGESDKAVSVSLEKEQLEEIGEYVCARLGDWLTEKGPAKPLREGKPGKEEPAEELGRRLASMEEGFERMESRFDRMDKRFDRMEKRVEQVDKRFEETNKGIETMDKRFDALTQRIDRFAIRSLGVAAAVLAIAIIF